MTMTTLKRMLRHLLTTTASGKRAFPEATLKAIQNTIADGERTHRAEIRMVVETALDQDQIWQGLNARQRAHDLFAQYRIWDTEENCGVLIYVNLADHKVEIIADRGVNRALDKKDWNAVCQLMAKGFAQGLFHASAVSGIEQLNTLLTTFFPSHGGTENELSNRPIVL